MNLPHCTAGLRSTPPRHCFIAYTNQTNRLICLYLFPVCGIRLGPPNPWGWRYFVTFTTSGNTQQNICDCLHSFATDIVCAALPCLIFLFVHVETCPFAYTFYPLVAYCSALKKETASISTGLVNFFQFACHHIRERGVFDRSTLLYVLKVTAGRPRLLFTEFWHSVFLQFCSFICY